MTHLVERQATLSRPRESGARIRDGGVGFRVGLAVLAALAWMLAIGLVDHISPSAREVSEEASVFASP